MEKIHFDNQGISREWTAFSERKTKSPNLLLPSDEFHYEISSKTNTEKQF